jgi:hypothetical protein
MFYDTAKVDIALLCKHCEGRLDIPKILPCGKTICSFCEKSIQVNENKFELEIQKLKDAIFDGKKLIFEKNKDQINKSILGITKLDKYRFFNFIELQTDRKFI